MTDTQAERAQPTPGPWQLGPHSIISSGWEIWRGKQRVAEVGDLRDARLIAAAPDMLKALKHCLGILCESGNLNNYRNLSDAELGKAWVETAKEAAAVLDQAEGRNAD